MFKILIFSIIIFIISNHRYIFSPVATEEILSLTPTGVYKEGNPYFSPYKSGQIDPQML